MDNDNEKLYHKVRSLLRKAESTDSEQEAQVFYEKAQQFIMRYAIDEEAMWAADPEKRARIETLDITINDRTDGTRERRAILNACANANRCKMWYKPGADTSTIAGFNSDLLFVEMLYSSILTQMNFKMAIGLAISPDIHARTFKSSFQVGFADRVAQRLIESTRKNIEVMENEIPGTELVLADRKLQVAKWVNDNMNLRKVSANRRVVRSESAYSQGTTAAEEVDITGGKNRIEHSERRGLGRS
jgi:hypothetical protein